MNKIESRYTLKSVNPDYYDKIDINSSIESNEPGIIYAPYIMCQHTIESLKEYNKFMKKYHKLHEVCPHCGSNKSGLVSLMGYPLISGKENEYKDLNSFTCSKCGSICTVHDRISKKEFENINK